MAKLVIGMTLKITGVDLEEIIASDWISERTEKGTDLFFDRRVQ